MCYDQIEEMCAFTPIEIAVNYNTTISMIYPCFGKKKHLSEVRQATDPSFELNFVPNS
jgi:hypothetical protein